MISSQADTYFPRILLKTIMTSKRKMMAEIIPLHFKGLRVTESLTLISEWDSSFFVVVREFFL